VERHGPLPQLQLLMLAGAQLVEDVLQDTQHSRTTCTVLITSSRRQWKDMTHCRSCGWPGLPIPSWLRMSCRTYSMQDVESIYRYTVKKA
jgi:hypothetical protein